MNPLTPQEDRIARMISNRKKFEEIADTLKITLETLRVHCRNIRQKLNVSLSQPNQVAQALQGLPPLMVRAKLSPAQHAVLTLRGAGQSFAEIAVARGTALSTVLVLSSVACRKLGIRGTVNPTIVRAALRRVDLPVGTLSQADF